MENKREQADYKLLEDIKKANKEHEQNIKDANRIGIIREAQMSLLIIILFLALVMILFYS